MKRIFFILVLCVFAADALAQRIPDMSMSPEETTQRMSNPNNFQSDVSRREESMSPDSQSGSMPRPMPNQQDIEPGKSFMEGYCDPNFVPLLANNRKYFGQEQCLKQIRDNACGQFKALPKEVKSVVDDAIGCMFANGNGYAVERAQDTENDSVACGSSYMRRIEMLKKYSGDYYSNYALLFMPDDVLDTSGRCINRK